MPAARAADLAFAATFAVMAAAYLRGLGRFLINDDEGSYLYAAWRISLGEIPYRDFLTPQLPGFLFPGAAVMRLFGPDVVPARTAAVVATLGAVLVVWWVSRRLLGPLTGALAGAALLLAPDVFLDLRTFRPDPFMLLLAWSGFACFARAVLPRPGAIDPPGRRWLALAGVLFGAGALTKLFAPFVLGGCLLWLFEDAWRRSRSVRDVALDLAVVCGAAAAVTLAGLGVFARTPVMEAVLGHHLAQGGELPVGTVLANGMAFFREYVRYHALEVFVALAAAWVAWREHRREATLFAWQLPTVLAFLFLSRELFGRHLIYVLPAVAVLAAWAASELWTSRARFARPAAVGLVCALFFPWGLLDRDFAWRREDGTQRVADLIALLSTPGELVLSDYSELNFYGLRPTTYSGASLSAGAASSGQITWRRLQEELAGAGQDPALVLVDRTEIEGESYGHLRFLHDVDAFEQWLQDDYASIGTVWRRLKLPDRQEHQVYLPRGREEPLVSDLGDVRLLAARLAGPEGTVPAGSDEVLPAAAGDTVNVVSAWRADSAPGEELALTVRLLDEDGHTWAQADQGLLAAEDRPTNRWVENELTSVRAPIAIPEGLAPGEYSVVLGVYDRKDGQLVQPESGPNPATVGRVVLGPWIADRVPREATVVAWGTPGGPAHAPLIRYAELLGVGPLPDGPIPAGDTLEVETVWRMVKDATTLDAHFELRPVGESGPPPERKTGLVVQPPAGVGSGSAGAADLPAGTVLRLLATIPVPATAAGDATLYLVDVEAESDDGGAGGGELELGTVQVVPRDLSGMLTEGPPGMNRSAAVLGGAAALAGWRQVDETTRATPGIDQVDETTRATPGIDQVGTAAGDDLEIELAWRALAPMARKLKATVQVLDSRGRAVAQHDAEPADWTRPTTSWVPGEVILDRHVLTLPGDVPPGRYRLVAALYDPWTGERLPLSAGGQGDLVELGPLEVRAAP